MNLVRSCCAAVPGFLLFSIAAGTAATAGARPEPGLRARYLALTAWRGDPTPVVSVDFVYGPRETVEGKTWQWWQLEARAEAGQDAPPLFQVRGLTSADPLAAGRARLEFARYMVRFPELRETLEYWNRPAGGARVPAWRDFDRCFVPRAAPAALWQRGVPETCEYLGHVLTLVHAGGTEAWAAWADANRLELDPELLVGTGRSFKDREGRRLPQQPARQDYHYVPFTEADYREMIEAGINLFLVTPAQERWVRAAPVFYLRGAGGNPPLRYPADLYRANYAGEVMFMDEPSILMVGEKRIHNTLRYFSDAAALIEKRTRATYESAEHYGAYALEKALRGQGVNFGDMRLEQWDYPSWETLYDTTFYQMKGGGNGLVHEGRYQLEPFDRAIAAFTGEMRRHTGAELLQYHYAFLRGGTRPFGKFWGTAIYGQCDTNLAPLAVTMAYDLGARYVWFWTSDHDHHVPWIEQIALARTLKEHARRHPRPSLATRPPPVDTAIAIPNGYFLSLDNLWWVRVLDKEGRNEASRHYRRLMKRALDAAHGCMDRGESFDLTVDDGRPIEGYRRVVRVDGRP
ncbi:MAG: hypothetical protein JXQ71_10830 [Verrucomicrobia bacterium]|nr:hypothetical protein [Verrucomicrobiota bacterium]